MVVIHIVARSRHTLRAIFLLIGAALLAGCLRNAEYNLVDQRANLAGAVQLFPNNDFEHVDLALLLDPFDKRKKNSDCMRAIPPEHNDIDAALNAFNFCYGAVDKQQAAEADVSLDTWRMLRRNQIQERILEASNQYCNVFKIYIQRAQSTTNFTLGSLATLTGVAGGIVTGLDGSRILSGLAGALSGVNAEFNQAFFLGKVVPVITKGIDLKRKQVYEDAVLHGQRLNYAQYDVESAIKDAITYHGACSVAAAFETAADSIDSVEHPGLDEAHRTVLQVKAIARELNGGSIDLKAYRKLRKIGYLEAGKPLPEDTAKVTPTMPMTRLVSAIEEVKKQTAAGKAKADTAPALKALDGGAEKVTAALTTGGKAILDNLTVCQDRASATSTTYYQKLRELAEAADGAPRKRAQTEVDIALDAAKAELTTIDSTVKRHGNAVDALLAAVMEEPLDSAAVDKAVLTFNTEIKAIVEAGCKPLTPVAATTPVAPAPVAKKTP